MTSWRTKIGKIENHSNLWTEWTKNHGNQKRINFLAHLQAEIGKSGLWRHDMTSWRHDGICMSAPTKEFNVCLDGAGFGLCGVDPPPTRAIERTEHQGECMEACALTPGCASYNYFYDSTRCKLFCVPFIQYAIVENCFNYVVRDILMLKSELTILNTMCWMKILNLKKTKVLKWV